MYAPYWSIFSFKAILWCVRLHELCEQTGLQWLPDSWKLLLNSHRGTMQIPKKGKTQSEENLTQH